jgi:flagellar hook-basal body complex protein FliE
MALGRVSGELPLILPTGGQFKVESPFKPNEEVRPTAFTDVFKNALEKVHESQEISKNMKTEFAAGRLDDIHGMMIAGKQAEIETRLLSNVRSKMLEAFQELWRINV